MISNLVKVFSDLWNPSDFKGQPGALLRNQIGHFAVGILHFQVLLLLTEPTFDQVLALVLAYFIFKEGADILLNKGGFKDSLIDTFFVGMGVLSYFYGWQGMEVSAFLTTIITFILAGVLAANETQG